MQQIHTGDKNFPKVVFFFCFFIQEAVNYRGDLAWEKLIFNSMRIGPKIIHIVPYYYRGGFMGISNHNSFIIMFKPSVISFNYTAFHRGIHYCVKPLKSCITLFTHHQLVPLKWWVYSGLHWSLGLSCNVNNIFCTNCSHPVLNKISFSFFSLGEHIFVITSIGAVSHFYRYHVLHFNIINPL